MTDRAEWWLHFAAGAAMAALELAVTGSAVLALFWPTLLGHAREAEQRRGKQKHPSAFWIWSSHAINEWMAWCIGASVPVCVYAFVRFV